MKEPSKMERRRKAQRAVLGAGGSGSPGRNGLSLRSSGSQVPE